MRRQTTASPAQRRRGWAHGTLVLLFCLVGLIAFWAAAVGDYAPRPPVRMWGLLLHDATIRVGLAAVGAGLLALAAGLWRYRRWSWYAAALIGIYMLYVLVSAAVRRESGALVHVDVLALLVVVCLPWLWLRRRRFGVGSGSASDPRDERPGREGEGPARAGGGRAR